MDDAEKLKIAAAAKALEYVSDGMRLGIGTGSTANEFIKLLAARVNSGLRVCGVPTSQRSMDLCRELGIPLATLEEIPQLDLTIDGADEIGPNLSLIKGGGGALLREKIVATASKQMLVIADSSKIVEKLGRFPVAIEVNQFGLTATKIAIEKAALSLGLNSSVSLRYDGNRPFVTDGGHFILDGYFEEIIKPEALANTLVSIPGVVEHGLFLNVATIAVIATEKGEILTLTQNTKD